ncbi:hypothetical protein NC653_016706 [Populus alba x Populus x berolinensis]|uniref:Uncharacterized protein n=1 Tax=Populus alba x Populus x berolinensis TaxID=444605 RepID=A0AAD6QNK2_9ROSI|nr:hypothetical protein NC653_016706 [Populus alba x Populus x berolinensis]
MLPCLMETHSFKGLSTRRCPNFASTVKC